MTMQSSVLRLQDDQLTDASQVLARAFFDDPMMTYIMPDEAQRRDILPAFMEAGSRLCAPHGEIFTTPGTVLGSANWLPPGKTEISDDAIAAAGMVQIMERMGEQAAGRFGGLLAQLGQLHEEAVSPDHWYLLILGVDPGRQGQGIGGSLIEPILRRADGEGRSCYLETMKPRNVTFYKKHGFDVVVEGDAAEGGLRFWTMRRDPR